MKSIKFAVAAAALAALAGCQNGGSAVSTYAGSIDNGATSKASPKTHLKKVGKVRRTDSKGGIYYVNKYARVPVKAKRSRTAYVAKPTRKAASTSAIAKVLKKSTTSSAKVRKVKHNKVARKSSKRTKNLDALIAKHARANGVPVKLARAVVTVESGGRVNARGAAGEIGLMQLMPRTARGIGYKGKLKNLYKPDTNLAYGMKYLGEAYRRGGKTTCGAILKYNAGHYAKRWNPTSRKYCKRVKRMLKKG